MEENSLDLKFEINTYLDADEDVLWYDKPVKKIVFTSADIFTTLFGVVWLSFSVFWIIEASYSTFEIFPFFGIPFVLIGLYLLFFRHVVSLVKRKDMIYVLTNRRAMIVHTGKRQYVQEYRYENISNVQMRCDDNDIGSIFFLTGEIRYNNGRGYSTTSGIFGIKDTKKVYKILLQYMENKKK